MQMGDVAVAFKIMLKSQDVNINSVKNEIISKLHPKEINIQDLAFGIKVIKALFIIPDSSGINELEDKIKDIEGVGEVETESLTL
ncbi:MAG: hypothetical protein QW631_03365, partial [Candidatus Aenigmatarchaeota archaeon]